VFLGVVSWATVALAAPRPVTRAEAPSVAREINLRAGDGHLTTVLGVSVNSTGPDVVVQRCGSAKTYRNLRPGTYVLYARTTAPAPCAHTRYRFKLH